MSSIDSDFLIAASVCISLFFLMLVALISYVLVSFKRLVKRANKALTNVENITGFIENVGKKTTLISLIKGLKFLSRFSKRS